jgi:flagellar basal-body rod modification protein FlgD
MTTTAPVTTTVPPTTSSSGSTPDAMSQLSGNFSTFLTLLTTQLKNQDPTSPMDSSTFTQQLVEYSQVEQQIDSNTNLKTLITQGQSQSGAYATSYLGKTVTVTNGQSALVNGAADWSYTLGANAASTTLSVTDANGKTVYNGAGAVTAGANDFAWNGKDNNGNQHADGTYTLNATSLATDGSTVTTSVSSTGKVGEVDMTSGTPQLGIGSMRIGLSSIANVQN